MNKFDIELLKNYISDLSESYQFGIWMDLVLEDNYDDDTTQKMKTITFDLDELTDDYEKEFFKKVESDTRYIITSLTLTPEEGKKLRETLLASAKERFAALMNRRLKRKQQREEDSEFAELTIDQIMELSDEDFAVYSERVIKKRAIRGGKPTIIRKSDRPGYRVDSKTGREIKMSGAERKRRSDAAKKVSKRAGIRRKRIKSFSKSIQRRKGI